MAGLTKPRLLFQREAVFFIPARSFTSKTFPRQSSITSDHVSSTPDFSLSKSTPTTEAMPPLSILPLGSIIRSLAVTSISSSPILLSPSLKLMSILAHSKSPLLSPDNNRFLGFFLKHTFYRQFCAGETPQEVRHTIDSLKSLGFKGVILGYAREVVLSEEQTKSLSASGQEEAAEACIRNEITPWAKGTLETVKLAGPEDFIALKFTGAGSQALYDLSRQAAPSPALREAIDSICDVAAARGVRLLFDAEQYAVQAGIDAWTLEYMRKYNHNGKAVIYGTYQAYLKSTPSLLVSHLAAAQKEGFTLGVKLVRGAYLGSDPRHVIHDTKADTDACYDGIAAALVTKSYTEVLKPVASEEKAEAKFPKVDVVLAGHNHTSVRKVQSIRTEQALRGTPQTELVYAQLQGMADDISCELVYAGQQYAQDIEAGNSVRMSKGKLQVDVPKAYKYLVWGTTGECMKYLLRRANENKDAVQRTREGRDAMGRELWRRIKKGVRFA